MPKPTQASPSPHFGPTATTTFSVEHATPVLLRVNRADGFSSHMHKGVFEVPDDKELIDNLIAMKFKREGFGRYTVNLQSLYDRGRPQDAIQGYIWDSVIAQARNYSKKFKAVGLKVG